MPKIPEKDVSIWMPIYIGDYLKDTMHLTTEEHGAYLLILFGLWEHDGYLYDNHKSLAALTRMTPARFKKTWKILRPFFRKNDQNFLYKNRLLEELDRARSYKQFTHKRAVNAANARWNGECKDATSNASSNASRMLCAGEGAGKGKGSMEKDNFIEGIDLAEDLIF